MRLAVLLLTLPLWLYADTYTISGVVVQHGPDARVPRARVTISSADGRQAEVSTTATGQFTFTGLAAGKYLLAAEYRGHRQLLQEHEGFSTSVVTGPGLDSEHIVFPLDGAAAIRGSVRDETGDPVANARLFLFERAIIVGRPKVKLLVSGVMTDSAGEFRFRNLKPGAYFLAAQGRPWFAQYRPRMANPDQNTSQGDLDTAYPLTYYADSTNPAEATPLTLTEGVTVDAQLTLRTMPAVHIQVEGAAGAALKLFHQGLGGIEIPALGTTFFSAQGVRELSGVTPGSYSAQLLKPGSLRPSELGRLAITLNGDAALNLDELPKIPDAGISGTVTVMGGSRAKDVSVWLENVASDDGRVLTRSLVGPNGEFRFDPGMDNRTPPGRYELRLSGGLYLKSVAVKGAEYSRGELEVREGSQIQLSIAAAKAEDFAGVVTKDGQPFGGAMVLLVPQDFSHGAAIPRDQSDSDGTFKMTSVAPGRYTLLAIETPGELAYHDPAAIAPYLKQGQILELPQTPGTQTKVEVQRQIP